MSEDPGSRPESCPGSRRREERGQEPAELSVAELSVIEKSAKWRSLRPGLEDRFPRAIEAALAAESQAENRAEAGEVTLILADDAFQRELNRTYRGVDKSTNVLAFADLADREIALQGGPVILGDIVLAYETCAREAEEQDKDLADHALHLAVHGLLHLLGFDHDTEDAAATMEALERQLLAPFGIADPYAERMTESAAHG